MVPLWITVTSPPGRIRLVSPGDVLALDFPGDLHRRPVFGEVQVPVARSLWVKVHSCSAFIAGAAPDLPFSAQRRIVRGERRHR